jgi:putative inorganic carbon (HCO3(-)) transporter
VTVVPKADTKTTGWTPHLVKGVSGLSWPAMVVGAGAGSGVLVGIVAGSGAASTADALLAAVAIPAFALGTYLALLRFDLLLLSAIAARMTLDAVRLGEFTGGTLLAAFFSLAAAMQIARWLARGEFVTPTLATKSLLVLSLVASLSAVTSDFPLVAAEGALRVLAGALMFVVLEQLLHQQPKFAKRVLAAVAVSAIVPMIFAVYQFVTHGGNLDTAGFNRVYGTAVHPTPFATYLMILLVGALAWATHLHRFRWAFYAGAVASGWLLLQTYTRSAWIAAAGGAAFIVLRHRLRLLVPLAALVTVAIVTVPEIPQRFADLNVSDSNSWSATSNSLAWRLTYWDSLMALAEKRPITGLGLGTTPRYTVQQLEPHNVYVQAYVELGYLGLAAMAAVPVAFLVTIRRWKRDSDHPWVDVVVVCTTGVGAALVIEALSSNVLTQTMYYWYFAAITTWGLPRPAKDAAAPVGRKETLAQRPETAVTISRSAAYTSTDPVGRAPARGPADA